MVFKSSYAEEIQALRSAGAPIEYPVAAVGVASAPTNPTNYLGSALRIPMVEGDGTYSVPVTINDQITLNFVVDSGASDVQVPKDVVSTLIRTGTITDQDFIGSQIYVLADGSKIPSARFLIRSLKIGNRTLNNVAAGLGPESGSLLLGQSFLNRFGSWSMDNSAHVLVLNAAGIAVETPPASPSVQATAPVQGFYLALGAGNGRAAANFMLPGKRTGPFDPDAMSKYYGNMLEPLRVKSIDQIEANRFLVDYRFRGPDRSCDGKAVVSTVVRDGIGYIELIHALNGC